MLKIVVQKTSNEMLFYSEEIEDSEYDSVTEWLYIISSQSPETLDAHLQSKVGVAEDVGQVFVTPSGAAGNFSGYMFSVNRAQAAVGVVEGWVGALVGQLIAPHYVTGRIKSIRGTFRNIDDPEDTEQPFASSGFSLFVKRQSGGRIAVTNRANVARFVRIVVEGEE